MTPFELASRNCNQKLDEIPSDPHLELPSSLEDSLMQIQQNLSAIDKQIISAEGIALASISSFKD